MDTTRPAGQACTLSIYRAFVVRLYPDFNPGHGCVHGQVEHVVSGECDDFQSIDDLLRFVGRVLNATGMHTADLRADQ